MFSTYSIHAENAMQANCICSLVGATRLVALAKPKGMVFTHRTWLKASPPVEAYSN